MTTIRVSSNSELTSAIRSADAGDTILLSGGTYSLSASGGNLSGVTIAAASAASAASASGTALAAAAAASQVNFSSININNAKNVTFDGVKISGNGSGTGLSVKNSDHVTFENSTITGFKIGAMIRGSDDFTFRNNTVSKITFDGMIMSGMQNGTISGNSISLNVKNGAQHSDGIQFYGGHMSNVTIQNNLVETNNKVSHGIYGGNGSSSYYSNITIDHNTVISRQVLGIAVGETHGLKITNNIVLRDLSENSGAPKIRVNHDATGVTISGNVTHTTPEASGVNWQPTGKSEPGWTIANNKIVSVGTSLKTAESLAPGAGAPDSVKSAGAASSATASVAETLSADTAAAKVAADGAADTFRFDGNKGTGGQVNGLDFDTGDRLVLRHFDAGTFEALAGGNPLQVSAAGTMAKIDSLLDLRELDRASSKVSVHSDGDTLVLDIAQKGADHVIELAGLAHAYADLI